MRILLITADYPPIRSGEASHALYLAKNLARRGQEVHILTSAIPSVQTDASSEFTVHPVMQTWTWRDLPRLARVINDTAPHGILLLFLGSMYRHHPMMTFAATIARVVRPSVRVVTQFENLGVYTWAASRLTRLVRRIMTLLVLPVGIDYQYGTLLRDSHRLIVLCDMHRTSLAKHSPHVNAKHILVPPPPIMKVLPESASARRQTRAALGIAEDEFILIYYGYVYPGKGLESLIQCMYVLRQKGARVRGLIVGGVLDQFSWGDLAARRTDYFQQLRRMAEGLGDRLIWTGPCDPAGDEASAYFRAADACMLPFDTGVQLNNSSFAAAAVHGLPIITTCSETTEAAFADGENVLLCRPKSPEELAVAVGALMASPELRTRLILGIGALADQWFSWDQAVQRTIHAFSPIQSGQPHASAAPCSAPGALAQRRPGAHRHVRPSEFQHQAREV